MIQRRCLAAVAIGAVLLGVVPSSFAAGTAEVVAGLQRWLDETHDLQCRFEQILVSGALGAGLSESGRLYLERPGRMRWEYTRPESKVALLNQDEALLYLEEDAQLIRGGAGWNDSLLVQLLAGEERLERLFRASLVTHPEQGGDGGYRLELVPLASPGGVESVTLSLRGSSFEIEAAEVLDEAGNRMQYKLSALKRNRGISADRFVFHPPPGTEILDPS